MSYLIKAFKYRILSKEVNDIPIDEWHYNYAVIQTEIWDIAFKELSRYYRQTNTVPTSQSKGVNISTICRDIAKKIMFDRSIHIPNYIYYGIADQIDMVIKRMKKDKKFFSNGTWRMFLDEKLLPRRKNLTVVIRYNQIPATMFKPEQDIGLSKKEKLRIRWSGRIRPEEFGKPTVMYIKKCFNKYTVSFPLRHPYEYVSGEYKKGEKQKKKLIPKRHITDHNLGFLGADPGQEPLLTFHDGKKLKNIYSLMPEDAKKKCKRLEDRLETIERILAHKRNVWKKKGCEFDENNLSNSYRKQRRKKAKLHYKLDNIKKYWIGVYAKTLAIANRGVAIEKYDSAKHKKKRTIIKKDGTKVSYKIMGRKIQKNSPVRLINALLDAFKYQGRATFLIKPHKYAPTQTCSDCGHKLEGKNKLKPGVKVWTCPDCGMTHDRDINAAKNIWKIATKHEGRRYETIIIA